MRFVCDSCRAQYMISDEKVGPKGVKVRCKKCGYVILVKKADGNAHSSKAPPPPPPSAPVPLSNDPDDALATQVMQNPLGYSPPPPPASISGEIDSTNPGINEEATSQMPAQGGGLLGASEDEIGAVFDSVLNSGAHSLPTGQNNNDATDTDHAGRPAMGDDGDDRMSTRVLDAHVAQQLADESAEGANGDAQKNGHGSNGNGNGHKDIPKTDWFVAIDDKQTGPLTLDRLKEHWERGEIGADSLCWRAGFSDWIPLSEVEALAAELAPRPSKPVIVPSAVVGGSMPPGGMMSVPVESAFSAGGLMKSTRSEVLVPLAQAGPEETGSWRPSAASALASLVKDEMEALAKPVAKMQHGEPLGVGENAPGRSGGGGGLLDLPPPEPMPERTNGKNGHSRELGSGPGEATMARGPANPYMQSAGATYSSPAVTQYRPPSNNTTLIAIIALAVVLVVFIGAGTLIFLNRGPAVAPSQPSQPIAMAPTQPVAQPPVGPPPVAAPPQPNGTVAAPAQPNGTAVNPTPTPAGSEQHMGGVRSPPSQPRTERTEHPKNTGGGETHEARPPREPTAKEDKPEKSDGKPEKKAVEVKGGDDEFSKAFGGDDSKPAPKKTSGGSKTDDSKPADAPKEKKTVYIPPAPGSSSAEVKDSLEQSDIMEVVKGNLPAIQNCVAQQRSKEPGTSGKLVMKWTILVSGKTSKVEVVSDEFKSTYLAGCVSGLIKSWAFPRTKTQGDPVVFPFKF